MSNFIDVTEELLEGVDRHYVANKSPDFYYCWLNKKADNLERMKHLYGFEILGEKHKENALLPPNPAGERVDGDLVLARMPMDRYKRIQELKKRKAAAQVNAANEQWKQEASKSGLKVDDTTEILTKTIKR